MGIRKRLTKRTLLVGATTALVIGVTAGTALAVNATWSVSPGGSFSFSGSGQVKDATTGTVAKCTSIKLSGTLKSGHGLAGASIGTITTASFTGCTIATISVTVTIGSGSLPWEMNALKFNASKGVTTGSIEDIDLRASAPGCSAVLDGTAVGSNNGLDKITYTNSTGKIALLGPGGNLHSFGIAPGTCFGLINNGDVQQASGSGTVTPKQTITSP